jgi:sugar lactone lactonase YvrE
MRLRRPLLNLSALSVALAFLAAPGAQARLGVHVFAAVQPPGYPADAVVAADGTVYAGTFKSFTLALPGGPSKVFAFSPTGTLENIYTVAGQSAGTADAVQVSNIDRAGNLYLLDQSPARVLKLDPRTRVQTSYATFATVPGCSGPPNGGCTLGATGNAPEPDFSAWGPDGSLYVTDYNQDLIWRIPPGGGKAKVWFTSAVLNGLIVGPAGIELMPDRHTLMFDSGGGGSDVATGKLYTLPILASGAPGSLHQVWESALGAAPDGIAIARSGNVYVAEVGPTGNNVVEIAPDGRQLAQVPANPVANELQTIPFDAPGSVTFDGNEILVGNQSSLLNLPQDMALLAVDAGEPGYPLSLPPAPPKPASPPAPRHRHRRRHRPPAHARHR